MNINIPQNKHTLIINLSSLSVDNNNIYHSVSSTFYCENLHINLETVLKRMETFNLRKFIIVNIVKDNSRVKIEVGNIITYYCMRETPEIINYSNIFNNYLF